MSKTTEHVLRIGEAADLRKSVFSASISIVYAGMLYDSTFSIVVKWSMGYNSLAYNLYFSDRQREIELPKGKIILVNVSRETILFKYQL